MIPTHWIHIYLKPAVGNAFIKRYPAYQYKHKISANGGFDTMSCALGVTAVEAEIIYENYIGNRTAVFVDNPAESVWEGYISRITYAPGGVSLTRSMDEMMNRVTPRTTRNNLAAPAVYTEDSRAVANNTDSQALFGIKAGIIDGGGLANGAAQTAYMDALRDTQLAIRAYPQVSMNITNQNTTQAFISLECTGFFHTLEDDEITSQGNVNAGTVMTTTLSNIANGATFFDNTDTSDVAANTTFNYRTRSTSAKSPWDIIKTLQEAGDSSGNRWVAGITPTLPATGTRRLFYRVANTTIEYTARLSDGLRLRNAYGGLVDKWRVRPDRGVRINDILVGWSSAGDDPREMYIETVEYDADRQIVTLRGVDDITWEGFFQFQRQSKAINRRAGAGAKRVVFQ